MADIVIFHHVQGRTDGILELAETLRSDGHTVQTPDLFDGAEPATIEDGVALTQRIGDGELTARADAAVADLPDELTYIGFSWGAMQAQRFAQTRPGARAAVLFDSCIPITGDWAFGPWPDDVSVQIHGMDSDAIFAEEGDLEAARELVQTVGPERAELFLYAGDKHLFADRSLPTYDPDAATLALQRVREFVGRVG